MKKGILIVAALISAITTAAADPQPLRLRLVCYSIFFHPAPMRVTGGIVHTHEVSSQGRFTKPYDGELALAPPEIPASHWGAFIFEDGQVFEDFPFNVTVDLPGGDTDGTGVPDLVEFGPAASGTTIGDYEDVDGGVGVFQAVWSKPANSHTGTCKITYDFTNPQFFQHTIEILNYEGTIASLTADGTNLHAQVTLNRSGVEGESLTGEVSFTLDNGVLKLTSTSLMHSSGNPFVWTNPDELIPEGKELYQFLTVTDGTPGEGYENFHDWLFSLVDPNDFDSDGIPDLIDPPSVTNPTEPRFEIIRNGDGIRLLIHGDIGRTYTLEDAASLATPIQWTHPTAVTLGADPHIIDLSAPTAPTFWRMRFP